MKRVLAGVLVLVVIAVGSILALRRSEDWDVVEEYEADS